MGEANPRDWIVALRDRHGLPRSPERERAHRGHLDLLIVWNPRAHLVSSADARGDGPLRHFDEALGALRWLPSSGPIVDLGSGGGFPGLVWATEDPERRVILIEANARKAAFLRECGHRMGLPRVEVVEEHVDDASRLASFRPAVLTTRATGLNDLLLETGLRLREAQPVVLVCFPRRDDRELGPRAESASFAVAADESLGEGRGRLLVLASG